MRESVGRSDLDHSLLCLLRDPEVSPSALLQRLAELRRKSDGEPACSHLLEILTGLEFKESEAEACFKEIAGHWSALEAAMGRDPGLPVATFDYFINIDPHLHTPRMIEIQKYLEMERQAETDPLTGLANRRLFSDSARAELRRAGRYGLVMSILFFDLDDFKDINDRWGHQFGDVVLRELARILNGAIRDVDLAARYGGEEFAVLLPETRKAGAVAVAERIRARVEQRYGRRAIQGQPIRLTVSSGVTAYPEDGKDLETLLHSADEALYAAKSSGKNRVVPARAERRRSGRLDLPGALQEPQVLLLETDGETAAPGTARNISRSGVLVETDRPIAVGSQVELHFRFDGGTSPLVVDGRVVRRFEPDTSGQLFDVGIAFDPPPGGSGGDDEKLEQLFLGRIESSGGPEPGTAG